MTFKLPLVMDEDSINKCIVDAIDQSTDEVYGVVLGLVDRTRELENLLTSYRRSRGLIVPVPSNLRLPLPVVYNKSNQGPSSETAVQPGVSSSITRLQRPVPGPSTLLFPNVDEFKLISTSDDEDSEPPLSRPRFNAKQLSAIHSSISNSEPSKDLTKSSEPAQVGSPASLSPPAPHSNLCQPRKCRVKVELSRAKDILVVLSRRIFLFKGPHFNKKFRTLREDCVRIQIHLDSLQVTPEEREIRKLLLTEIESLIVSLNSKVHSEGVPCPDCPLQRI